MLMRKEQGSAAWVFFSGSGSAGHMSGRITEGQSGIYESGFAALMESVGGLKLKVEYTCVIEGLKICM